MAPKQKPQKMSIGTFLQDENFGPSSSWADEMDDVPLPSPADRSTYGERRAFTSSSGYNPEMHAGYAVREELPLPTQPPYTAHIGNLSFDADQDDINALFADCEVTSVRIVEDKLTHQPKGFGYVEFASVEGLKKALTFLGTSLKGRNIRVSVAEPPKERHDARDIGDWTRKGPLPDLPGQQRRVSDRGPRQPFDTVSEAGGDRPGRRGYEPADGKSRDFSNWERKGPLSPPTPMTATFGREGGRPRSKDGPQFRRASPAWGEGRSQDGGSRPPRREFQERPLPERTPTAPELDNQWRARMRPDAPAPPPAAFSVPSPTTPAGVPVANTAAPAAAAAAPPAAPAPAMRPKLNLQKRTVPEQVASPSAATADSKSSPFGAARPIDTAAKEKEIEERRVARAKEAEEKAKAEKAEKAEKQRVAKEEEEAKEKATKAAGTSTENKDAASDVPQGSKNFEILQRPPENGEEAAASTTSDAASVAAAEAPKKAEEKKPEAAAPTKDTTTTLTSRPAPTQTAPPSKTNGAWRNAGPPPRTRGGSSGPRNGQTRGPPKGRGGAPANGPPPAAAAPAPAPAEPEEEGWSTVSTKQRGNRRQFNRQ